MDFMPSATDLVAQRRLSMAQSTFLRRVLIADAFISGITGVLMLAATRPISQFFEVPVSLLFSAGVSLLPFTAFLIWLCTRPNVPRSAVWFVIALNLGWVIGSIALLFVDRVDPNRIGVAFILVQAIAVLGFAEMQYVGLRKLAA
jgi:hypothetical protein